MSQESEALALVKPVRVKIIKPLTVKPKARAT
jgi:hypothetical protein